MDLPDMNVETVARVVQKPISESKRFAILVIGAFGCICCSFSYAFNLVSSSMQERYDFTQRDMSSIVTVGLVFQYCVLPYAFLFDFFGPLPISILATIYFPLGCLLMALCFQGTIEGSVVRLCVFNALMGMGCSLFDLGCCITVLLHFPVNRGPVTALLKTFTGLGSSIVGSMFLGFFKSQVYQYYYFLMALAIVVGFFCIAFLRLPEYYLSGWDERVVDDTEREKRHVRKAQYLRQEAPIRRFVYGFIILVILIVFLPMESALVSYLNLSQTYRLAFAVVASILTIMFIFVAAPLRFFDSPTFFSSKSERDVDQLDDDNAESSGCEPFLEIADKVAGEGKITPDERRDLKDAAVVENAEPIETELDYLAPQYQGTFIQNLCSMELWALWWTFFTVVGTEFVVIFNATPILTALSGEKPSSSLATLLTVLNGVGSAVGRLAMSIFEVWSQKRKAEERIPITISLFLPTSTIIVTIVLFLVLPAAALPLPYVIAALGNGFLAAVTILVTRTIFAQDPAKHYNFCFTATMTASIVFNRFLYGEWYAVQAEKQGDKICYGKKCVMMPLLVLLGVTCSAFATDVVLHLRYCALSRRVLAQRAALCEQQDRAMSEHLSGDLGDEFSRNNREEAAAAETMSKK